MKYIAKINVMPHKELLDPQGKAVSNNIHQLDIHGVHDVRIGKHIEMTFDASDDNDANNKVKIACEKLLTNRITERYSYILEQI